MRMIIQLILLLPIPILNQSGSSWSISHSDSSVRSLSCHS